MARVTGPLFSADASGKFAGALVYSKWKGRNTVRTLVTPKNPKSAKQVGVRSMLSFLGRAWAAISGVNQATWEAAGIAKAISPFNAFCGENLSRWQAFQVPTQANPAAGTSGPVAVTTMTLTGGIGYATAAITPASASDTWAIALFRADAEITVPDWLNCVAVVPVDGTNPVLITDSPLEPGTYHYRAAILNEDGVIGTVKADATAVVT